MLNSKRTPPNPSLHSHHHHHLHRLIPVYDTVTRRGFSSRVSTRNRRPRLLADIDPSLVHQQLTRLTETTRDFHFTCSRIQPRGTHHSRSRTIPSLHRQAFHIVTVLATVFHGTAGKIARCVPEALLTRCHRSSSPSSTPCSPSRTRPARVALSSATLLIQWSSTSLSELLQQSRGHTRSQGARICPKRHSPRKPLLLWQRLCNHHRRHRSSRSSGKTGDGLEYPNFSGRFLMPLDWWTGTSRWVRRAKLSMRCCSHNCLRCCRHPHPALSASRVDTGRMLICRHWKPILTGMSQH